MVTKPQISLTALALGVQIDIQHMHHGVVTIDNKSGPVAKGILYRSLMMSSSPKSGAVSML